MTAALATPRFLMNGLEDVGERQAPLKQLDYGDVGLTSQLHNQQLAESVSVLMGLSEDSLLKPFRQMCGQPAPGDELGAGRLRD
ncbi:MAG TPA: hypothetical protein VFF42_10115 [Candidatus Eremiobacteraceae bacterium]|nr:hypothetical protein [Candidatus Eremiobacteraceae bacterium]